MVKVICSAKICSPYTVVCLTGKCVIVNHCILQSIQNFLDNPHILEYIAELGNHKLQSVDSWFTRVETTMLADMLKLLKVVLPATVSAPIRKLFHNGHILIWIGSGKFSFTCPKFWTQFSLLITHYPINKPLVWPLMSIYSSIVQLTSFSETWSE